MCGRYGLTRSPWRLTDRLRASRRLDKEFEPRFNIAPTQPVLAVTNEPERPVVELRWGLVPYSADSPRAMKLSTFNARVETIATAPAEEDVRSCTIVTSPANEFMAAVHPRMPIVLSEAGAAAWLTSGSLAPAAALEILNPDEASPAWEMYAVSALVGNVRNDDARLVQRT